jgi:hypothetical protein
MYLLALLLAFGLLGYLLALSQRSTRRKDAKTRRLARQTAEQVRSRWNNLFARGSQSMDFLDWANGPGANLFPDDFKKWLRDLSQAELDDFVHSLAIYANSLGFSLVELVSGGLDREPIMRQVFVEAIVVYSPAYRRARQAQQEAEAAAKARTQAQEGDGKQAAEKSSSRRIAEPGEAPAEAEGAVAA